jgi:hypothetical protein
MARMASATGDRVRQANYNVAFFFLFLLLCVVAYFDFLDRRINRFYSSNK